MVDETRNGFRRECWLRIRVSLTTTSATYKASLHCNRPFPCPNRYFPMYQRPIRALNCLQRTRVVHMARLDTVKREHALTKSSLACDCGWLFIFMHAYHLSCGKGRSMTEPESADQTAVRMRQLQLLCHKKTTMRR